MNTLNQLLSEARQQDLVAAARERSRGRASDERLSRPRRSLWRSLRRTPPPAQVALGAAAPRPRAVRGNSDSHAGA
jgi:hypothetical protein